MMTLTMIAGARATLGGAGFVAGASVRGSRRGDGFAIGRPRRLPLDGRVRAVLVDADHLKPSLLDC